MTRGEIYIVDLSHNRFGSEQRGLRPAVVVSNDKINNNPRWKTVVVMPLSTSVSQQQRQYGVFFPKGTAGLSDDSVALCHQITTIDRNRLGKLIGKLTQKEMIPVDAELKIVLWLP